LSAGVPSQTLLGEFTAFPRPLSWILWDLLLRKVRGEEERGIEPRYVLKG